MHAMVPRPLLHAIAATACVLPSVTALLLPPLSRRTALGAALSLPAPALADGGFGPYGEPLSTLKQGAAADLKLQDNDAVARNSLSGGSGVVLYDSTAVDPAKVDAIAKRWATMLAGVHKALENEKASPAANAAAAKAAFDGGMAPLKTDMRAVAKALAGGDVTVRSTQTRGGGATADFDYNTGAFALQPIAEKPETIFRVLTDVYVNDLKAPAKALGKVATADALFAEWLAAVRGGSG